MSFQLSPEALLLTLQQDLEPFLGIRERIGELQANISNLQSQISSTTTPSIQIPLTQQRDTLIQQRSSLNIQLATIFPESQFKSIQDQIRLVTNEIGFRVQEIAQDIESTIVQEQIPIDIPIITEPTTNIIDQITSFVSPPSQIEGTPSNNNLLIAAGIVAAVLFLA